MKKLIAVFMICLTQVAFAQEGGVSKATAAYSTACEILQNAKDAEKTNDTGDAIIAYRMADEKFSQVRQQDPSYEVQHVDEYKKSIAEAIGRLELASQEPQPSPQKRKSPLDKKLFVTAMLISQGVRLLIYFVVSGLAMTYYSKQSYPTRVKYRTFLPRLWTMFVDSGVLWPVTVFIVLMYGMPQHAVAATAGALIGQIIYWCYMVIMHAKYGQTVGKMACRIKVVDAATEQAITFRQALLREGIPIMMGLGTVGYGIYFLWTGRPDLYFSVANGNRSLFWILAGPPTLWFLAEVITMFTNEKRRALHDLIAGTVVVRTNLDESAREQAVEIGKGPVAGASYDY